MTRTNVMLKTCELPIYILNINSNRWKHLMATFPKRLRKNIIRVYGIDGNSLTRQELLENTTSVAYCFGTNSMIGIHMSHLLLWKYIYSKLGNSDDYIIICEDDVQIPDSKRFIETVNDIVKKNKHDFCFLGHFGLDVPYKEYTLSHKILMYVLNIMFYNHSPIYNLPLGFHCYMVKASKLKDLIQMSLKANFHIDLDTSLTLNNAYTVLPPIAYQPLSKSNTHFPIFLNRMIDGLISDKWIKPSYFINAEFNIGRYITIRLADICLILLFLCSRNTFWLIVLFECIYVTLTKN